MLYELWVQIAGPQEEREGEGGRNATYQVECGLEPQSLVVMLENTA